MILPQLRRDITGVSIGRDSAQENGETIGEVTGGFTG